MINSYSKRETKFYMQWSESSTLSQAQMNHAPS